MDVWLGVQSTSTRMANSTKTNFQQVTQVHRLLVCTKDFCSTTHLSRVMVAYLTPVLSCA